MLWVLWLAGCSEVDCVSVDPHDVSLAYEGCAAATQCCELAGGSVVGDCWIEVDAEVIACTGDDCEDAIYEFLGAYCEPPSAGPVPRGG